MTIIVQLSVYLYFRDKCAIAPLSFDVSSLFSVSRSHLWMLYCRMSAELLVIYRKMLFCCKSALFFVSSRFQDKLTGLCHLARAGNGDIPVFTINPVLVTIRVRVSRTIVTGHLYSTLLWDEPIARDAQIWPVIARGSHSFTCHPLANHTCLYSPVAGHHRPLAGTHYAYPRRDGQAELTWVIGYILR